MSDYVKLTVATLRAELGRRGLPKSGKKNEMIQLLCDDDEKRLLEEGGDKPVKIITTVDSEVEQEDSLLDVSLTNVDSGCVTVDNESQSSDSINIDGEDKQKESTTTSPDLKTDLPMEVTTSAENDKPQVDEDSVIASEDKPVAVAKDKLDLVDDKPVIVDDEQVMEESKPETTGESSPAVQVNTAAEAKNIDNKENDKQTKTDQVSTISNAPENMRTNETAEAKTEEKAESKDVVVSDTAAVDEQIKTDEIETNSDTVENTETDKNVVVKIENESESNDVAETSAAADKDTCKDNSTPSVKEETAAEKVNNQSTELKTEESSSMKIKEEKKAAVEIDQGTVHIDTVGEVDDEFDINMALLEDQSETKLGEEIKDERDDDDVDKSPAGLGRLHGWICDGFANGKKQCALYVCDLKKYKLLSDVMMEVGKQAVQFVLKLEMFGKGCAGFNFNHIEQCVAAQTRLKEAYGEGFTVYSGLDAPSALMSLNAKELSGQLQVEHMLMIQDYPESASMTSVARLFPNAIFMTRISEAASTSGEKRWFEKSYRHGKERYEPPSNYKTLILVEFCSSHEVKAAAEAANKEAKCDDVSITCQTLVEYEELYKKEFEKKRLDMTMERIYKDEDRLEMLDVLFQKREQLRILTVNIRRQRGDSDEREKQRTLSREVNDITAALRIDSMSRVKVSMAVPEGSDKFTKHTRYLYQQRRLKSKKEEEKAKEREKIEKEKMKEKAAAKAEEAKKSSSDKKEKATSSTDQEKSKEKSTPKDADKKAKESPDKKKESDSSSKKTTTSQSRDKSSPSSRDTRKDDRGDERPSLKRTMRSRDWSDRRDDSKRMTRPHDVTSRAGPPRNSTSTCYHCGEIGHFARECPNNMYDNGARRNHPGRDAPPLDDIAPVLAMEEQITMRQQQIVMQQQMLEKYERMMSDQQKANMAAEYALENRRVNDAHQQKMRAERRDNDSRAERRGYDDREQRHVTSPPRDRAVVASPFHDRHQQRRGADGGDRYRPDERSVTYEERGRHQTDRSKPPSSSTHRSEAINRRETVTASRIERRNRGDGDRSYESSSGRDRGDRAAYNATSDRDYFGAAAAASSRANGASHRGDDYQRREPEVNRSSRTSRRDEDARPKRTYVSPEPYSATPAQKRPKVDDKKRGDGATSVATVLKGLTQVINSKMDEIARKALVPTQQKPYATQSTDMSRPKAALPRAALPSRTVMTPQSERYLHPQW